MFPSMSCEPGLNIPTPQPPQPPPGTTCPILLRSLQKPLPGSTPLKALLPSGEGALEQDHPGQECSLGTETGVVSALFSVSTPPCSDCSWTVNALCLHGDKACLLQPSPRAENFLWLSALYFRKVPVQEPGSVFWQPPQCP